MSQLPDLPSHDRRLALFVGVDYAPEAQDKQIREVQLHASKDAKEMAKVLQTKGRFQLWGEGLFLNEKATSQDIKDAILSMEQQSTKDDLLLFYFSGHGLPISVERDTITYDYDSPVDVYLATWDFSEKMAKADAGSRISVHWLRNKLYNSQKAGQVVIILDCCYAGYMSRASDSPDRRLLQRISNFLQPPNDASGSLSGGARLALLATGHTGTTRERHSHGFMTSYLLPALQGKVDGVIDEKRRGAVTLARIRAYLVEEMPDHEPTDLVGGDAGQKIILTWHEQRARELLRERNSLRSPYSYIPSLSPHTFQQRFDELESEAQLYRLLERREDGWLHIVGLIGPEGVGKTRLACELAHRCRKSGRYTDGVFWVSAGDFSSWLNELARLALRAEYLPQNDDPFDFENEERRARNFGRYLQGSSDILLIIDDLKDALSITSFLPEIAGGNLTCTIVYTAIEQKIPGTNVYEVRPFSDEIAMNALLQSARPLILQRYQEQAREDEEVKAAVQVCRRVDNLPIALMALHKRLQEDPDLALTSLRDLLYEQGALGTIPAYAVSLHLAWDLIKDERQRRLFLLASLFPAVTPIPFWLLELVASFSEPTKGFSTFGAACRRLEDLYWIMVDREEKQIRLPQIQREFGLHLLREDTSMAEKLKAEAGRLLVSEWCDINRLQVNIQASNYWQCLEQVRLVRSYAKLLGEKYARAIERIERRLDLESVLLMHEGWWPERLPALLFQQLYNRAVEENDTPMEAILQTPWLRLEQPVGAEDRALLRIFGGHRNDIRYVAFSPDGKYILTASNDHTARIWENVTGKLHFVFSGHRESVTCAAFSADGQYVVTGSDDETICVWDYQTGELYYTFYEHSGGVTCIACSTDGSMLVSGSNDRSIRIWDINSGRQTTRWLAPMRINSLVLDERRHLVIFASDDTVWQWDYQKQKTSILRKFTHTQISALALSPENQLLAIGVLDPPVIHLWDCSQGIILHTIIGHTDSLHCLAFSSDGRYLLSGASDETARVWECESGRCCAILRGHIGAITSVAYAPDGRLLTGSVNHTARLWDEKMARESQKAFTLHDNLSSGTHSFSTNSAGSYVPVQQKRVYLTPQGRYALVLDRDNAEIWHTEMRVRQTSVDLRLVDYLAFSADGDHLLIGRKSELELHKFDRGVSEVLARDERSRQKLRNRYASEELSLAPVSAQPIIVSSADQRYRISADRRGRLICEAIAASQVKSDPQVEETEDARIIHTSFSPDGQLLLVSNILGRVFFFAWNGHAIGSLLGLYQAFGRVAALRWLEHGHVLIADIATGLSPHFHHLHLEGEWGRAVNIFH